MIQLKRILYPTDFSEASLNAMKHTLSLTREFDADVTMLHVIEDPVVYSPAFGGYAPNPATMESFAETRLESWISPDDSAGVRIDRDWVHGSPIREILHYAKEHEMDLVVMGTHGRGMLAHALIGSVAENVVRKAGCPALTVKPDDFTFKPIT